MNRLFRLDKLPLLLVAVLAVGYFAHSPGTLAVFPPPDGGYPGGNTAEGHLALGSLTNGTYNTAVGVYSLLSLTENSFNTAVGAGALLANTSGSNTATGAGALLSTTGGGNNTANGALALFSNTIGHSNTATGAGALLSNTEGYVNTASGFHALFTNTIGNVNTAIGESALFINSTGGQNTAVGSGALQNNTTGNANTALGIAAGSQVTTASSVISIGTSGANVSNSCFIGHIRNVATANNDALPVLIDSTGQLGTVSSSRRFKDDIKPMDKASEAVLALKPVTFRYKSDQRNRPEFGLIAEEVAEENPDLVVRDENGQVYTVRYDAVNAMLLNEFLKEHRKVQQLEAIIAQLKSTVEKQEATDAQHQKRIESLAAGLQKVNSQIEMNQVAPQVVANK